jgi:hypothetical protein
MRFSVSIVAVALLGSFAAAQSEDRAPASAARGMQAPPATPVSSTQTALGTLLQGPLDVQSPITAAPTPGAAWNRLLGTTRAWGYLWVSGGAGTTGAFAIHQYTLAGAYIQSFTQDMTGAASTSIWGIRDLTVDEPNFKLWGGMENRVLKEYTFNPGAGPNGTLTYTTTYQIPIGGAGFIASTIIRALHRDPSGVFFTKNFNSQVWRFNINGGIPIFMTEYAGNGKATYGLGQDPVSGLMWQFDQFPASATDAVEFNEIDPANGTLTGRSFPGITYAVLNQNVAGGCEVFNDGSGFTKVLGLHQNVADELYVYELDATSTPPTTYCTSSTTTNGCNPAMSASGTPSASASSGFTLTCNNVEGQKTGLIFYSITGQNAVVWAAGSTSFLCVKSPTQRMPSHNSGGTTSGCDGTIAEDFLAFIATHPTALGTPLAAGQVFDSQCWFRDPPAPKTTNLSNGLEFTLVP